MRIEKEGKVLSLAEFESLCQIKYLPKLQFDESILEKTERTLAKTHKKGDLAIEQVWLGKYFEKEILAGDEKDLIIRFINHDLGWGVFAGKAFRKMEFIAEYTGFVRKRTKMDAQNSYCFEYLFAHGLDTQLIIDAKNQGGVSRFINHSSTPNLASSVATFNNVSHIILYANRPIAKDEQLCYDYGPDYWSKRGKPNSL